MTARPPRRFAIALALALALTVLRTFGQVSEPDPWSIDFRYAPANWQTSICLPDDWQKTLVGKDGALLYDYPGRFAGFGTKVTADVTTGSRWITQALLSPRIPIVQTRKESGMLEVSEEAFAVAPPRRPASSQPSSSFAIERVGAQSVQENWAKPQARFDPAFRNVAIGWAQPVQYRFKARRGEHYTVIFGLCEGHHDKAGQRLLDLQIEGKTRQTVDPVAAQGKNAPALYSFEASDENGDGWVDLAVASAAHSPDNNAVLNVLWVFRQGDASPPEMLLAGQSVKPALAHLDCGWGAPSDRPPRHDVLVLRLRNKGNSPAQVTPTLTIESERAVRSLPDSRHILIGGSTTVFCPQPYQREERSEGKLVLLFGEQTLDPGAERVLVFGVARGAGGRDLPESARQAESLRKEAQRFWQRADLPYGHLEVPDPGVQALLDSSIRNIYQAREIKKGLPAFQVGPTCYRGLWVVDGSFLLEAISYLGRTAETRSGIQYLLSFQREDGGIMLIDGHWKETGIALWAVTRHARLTGDKTWLREVWPKVERGFAYIQVMRQMASANPHAPNAGLIPDGFSDGGLADKVPEYTNIYWTLAGMHAAVEAARWLNETAQADTWQRQYDDFYQTFRRAAERDMRSTAQGARYLPIRMAKGEGILPQKAQWAFLHSIFPGKIYASADPLVQGGMAMLRAHEQEGLVLDTGWLKEGIWNYFGSFYGHAWLWLGDGDKAARTLYAFGNHASPLLVWREEQMPVGHGEQMVGDMPHNWASAEFIRLVRHSLLLERGDELHVFEALPASWVKPGAVIRVRDILTEFGAASLELQVARDGATAELKLQVPSRTPPQRVVLHLDHWSAQKGTIDLPATGTVRKAIPLSLR